LIVAFSVFILVKAVATFRRKQEAAPVAEVPAPPSAEVELLTEIRDLLNKK